ncbi:serine protease [Dechloromonas sp.]|uniref:S1 family peptidase n=1 Tax=Dechloromonas sp. TaxID=1917218 RepID=UPI002172E2CA|nr:serine protease [Dechloromonas sp.]MBU3697778.1 trypsin-like peptidase domain-containing protein [Dechloromonas sp.]
MLRQLLGIVVLLQITALSHAATWVTVGSSGNKSHVFSYDRDRIGSNGSLVTAWIQQVSDSPIPRGQGLIGLVSESAHRKVSRTEIDCQNISLSYLESYLQSKDGRNLQRDIVPEDKREATSVPPGSAAEQLIISICQDATMQAAALKENYNKDDPETNPLGLHTWEHVGRADDGEFTAYFSRKSVAEPIDGNPMIRSYLARMDIRSKRLFKNRSAAYSVTRVLADCQSGELRVGNTAYYDESEQFIDRVIVPPNLPAYLPKRNELVALIARGACSVQLGKPTTASSEKKPQPAQGMSTGTAWYAGNGYFVTASHVTEGKQVLFAYFSKGNVVELEVIKDDPKNDIVLLKAIGPLPKLRALQIASGVPSVGAKVFTMGFPHVAAMGIEPKFTSGEISSRAGMRDDPRYVQISTPVQSGNSGGPLLNSAGHVVGIITAKLKADVMLMETGDITQNVNYALKGSYVKSILDAAAITGTQNAATPKNQEELAEQLRKAVVLVVAQ